MYNGGRLDGALGVVAALEAIEVVLDAPDDLPVPPTLAVFRAEESARFGQATIGSKGAVGLLTVEIFSANDHGNVPLWQATQEEGYRPQDLAAPTLDLDRVAAFLELHIEQGRVLEKSAKAMRIVAEGVMPHFET